MKESPQDFESNMAICQRHPDHCTWKLLVHSTHLFSIGIIAVALLPLVTWAGHTTIVSNGFNSATCPPGWATEVLTNLGGNPAVTFVTSSLNFPASPYEGSHFVAFNSSQCFSGSKVRLKQTNSFSTLPYGPVTVNFAWFQTTNDTEFTRTGKGVMVQWSMNGTNWSNGEFYRHYNSTSNGWQRMECSLPSSALARESISIAFEFTSQLGWNCYLDDVRVDGHDGIASITPSMGPLAAGNAVTIRGAGMGNRDVTNVTICGIPATILADNSPTQIVVSAGSATLLTSGNVVLGSSSCGLFVKSNAYAYLPLGTYCTDAVNGNDTAGSGSMTNPWRTIGHAVSNIFETNAVLFAAAGTYGEAVVVPSVCQGLGLIGAGADVTRIDASVTVKNGGAIKLPTGSGYLVRGFTITGGTFEGSSGPGGAVRGATASATIEENRILYNYSLGAGNMGGGVTLGSNSVVRRNMFFSNSARYGSGAVYVGPYSIIEENYFDGNFASLYPGGAIIAGSTTVMIRRNTFNNNSSSGGSGQGGAIYGQATIRNNLFLKNSCVGLNDGWGGACYLTGGSLVNNTFVGNIGDVRGAASGVYCRGAVEAVNNVIVDGIGGVGLYVYAGSSGTKDYNCFWNNNPGSYGGDGVTPGANDLETNPLFLSASDFHIAGSSACVNAGTNLAWMGSEVDIDGQDRIINGRVDIGAYEYAPIYVTVAPASDGTSLRLSWPADCLGWELQAHTNSLIGGLDTNWFPVPGSTTTNLLVIPIDLASPSVFFRLYQR